MTRHNAENERIKREYEEYLRGATSRYTASRLLYLCEQTFLTHVGISVPYHWLP
jgi:hypothetical protein